VKTAYVIYEAREPTAIGKFQKHSVVIEIPDDEGENEAYNVARQYLNKVLNLDTRFPVSCEIRQIHKIQGSHHDLAMIDDLNKSMEKL
jgi:hypothetical protein